MGYAQVFGGELLFPSQTSYISITTAVDVTLVWPREQQIGGGNVVADFMDIDATQGGLNIDFPSATAIGTGNVATINNLGSNEFDVRDSTGGPIITIIPGTQWIIVLVDNTTAAGTWRSFQLGATVSNATASALGGAGIKAISDTLNQQIDSDVEAATPFTVVDGDRAKCLIYTAGAGTANLTAAGTLGNDWFFMLRNSGSGTLNVLPAAGLIDGAASINMDTNDSVFIFTDGTDFFTIGFGQGNTLAFDFVSIAVPGSGDFVLSGANLDRVSYRFTGLLTGNRRIVVPNTVQQYWVDNQTTGAFTLEIDTAAGAGQTVIQGESVILYCDATDVINATSATSVSFPITVGQGGTGSTTASGARTNLAVAFDGQDMIAGVGISGGGDLSADRTFDLDIGSLTPETAIAYDDEVALEDVSGGVQRKATVENLFAAVVPGAVKPGQTQRMNTTTETDDPDLAGFPLEPSASYIVEIILVWSGNGATGNGFRWSFDFNGQIGNVSAFQGHAYSVQDGGTAEALLTTTLGSLAQQIKPFFDNAGFDELVYGSFGLVTGAGYVSGTNIDLQWAQGTSFGTNTNLEDGSHMKVTRVA